LKTVVRRIDNDEAANRNILKMVLFMLSIYYFGYAPYTIRKILKLFNIKNSIFDRVTYLLVVLSKGSTIFVYYKFNRSYERAFKKMLLVLINSKNNNRVMSSSLTNDISLTR
jgi:hypothetical protein